MAAAPYISGNRNNPVARSCGRIGEPIYARSHSSVHICDAGVRPVLAQASGHKRTFRLHSRSACTAFFEFPMFQSEPLLFQARLFAQPAPLALAVRRGFFLEVL